MEAPAAQIKQTRKHEEDLISDEETHPSHKHVDEKKSQNQEARGKLFHLKCCWNISGHWFKESLLGKT